MKLLIRGGYLLLSENGRFSVERGDLEITDKKITGIWKGETEIGLSEYDKMIDARNRLVMPGLINAHTHAYMSLLRNYADDMEFFDWLDRVQAAEDHMTPQDCYWGTMLNIIEMIRTGTTSFVDMPIRSSDGPLSGADGTTVAAVHDSGMRAWLGRGMVGEADDQDSLRRFREFFKEIELFQDHDRITYLFGPHATYSCEMSLLRKIREYAIERQMCANIHIAESDAETEGIAERYQGMTPVEYIASSGLFDVPTIAAHCVNVSDEDLQILKRSNVSVAINPRSNMKLGNGFAPVDRMLEAGINICLGTDSCASNNTQNLFQEMNFTALIYKGKEKKARCVDAADVLRFATEGGAKALCMKGSLGVLAEGALADVILLDLDVPQFVPRYNLVSALAYSANGSEVRTVIVNGQILMEEGKLLTINEKEVFERCREIARRLSAVSK